MRIMETSGRGTKLPNITSGIITNSSNEKVSDHDLLVTLSNDMTWLKKIMGNHLAHHWLITIGIAGTLLTAVGTLVLYIITR